MKMNIMNIARQLRVFFALLHLDLIVLSKLIKGRLLNMGIWLLVNTSIAAYVLPELGMTRQFGPFVLAGLCGSVGFFEFYGRVVELIRDITHDKPLLYFATLPISLPLFVIRIVISNAMGATLLALCALPFGKLILGAALDLSVVNWMQLIPFLILSNLFYGAAAVVSTGCIKGIESISNVWIRIAYPLWFMGCYQFSYRALQDVLPWFAYINGFNPVVYIFEGTRAAIMGQNGFLPISHCFLVIGLCFVMLMYFSIVIIRRRLDLL